MELHLHLEGAIPLITLWELVLKYGGTADVHSPDALRQRFRYRDFEHFIKTWVWKNNFIREYDDFTLIAESVASNLSRQNIRYAEMFVSPPDFFRVGLKTQRILEAVRAGFDRVPEITAAIVVDLVRDFGPERAAITLREVAEVRQLGVAGVGIGGSEKQFPPEPFGPVFDAAREMGFHTSAHAGEAAGPESIWGAIRHLRVDRIGHGTSAKDDPDLIDTMIRRRIPIEMCPISNVCTGAVRSYAAHPVKQFFDRGVLLSVNTDDPMMFGNTLADEYDLLVREHGMGPEDMIRLMLDTVDMSWMAPDDKHVWRRRIIEDANRLLKRPPVSDDGADAHSLLYIIPLE